MGAPDRWLPQSKVRLNEASFPRRLWPRMAPRTRVTPGVMVDFAAYEEEMKAIICSLISSVLFYLFSSLPATLDESKEIYWVRQKLWFCLAEDRHTAMISHWPHALQLYEYHVCSLECFSTLPHPSAERAFGCRGWLQRRVWVSCPWIGFKDYHA